MKKLTDPYFYRCSKLLFRTMRTTIILILFSAFSVYSMDNYAQSKQLSLEMNNVPLKEVLQNIEQQSEFYFMYNNALVDVKQKVSVNTINKDVYTVLNHVLKDTDISYKVLNKQIVLTPASKGFNPENFSPQQGEVITGVVKNTDGETLPGVNITIKGTNKGTTTDIDGNYKINVSDESAVLVFSFVGYRKQEVPVKGKTEINVTLKQEMQKLDEVVVIGYGSSSKKMLSSSISSVEADDIEETVASGVQEALQGKTSGVHINRNSGTPGSGISVNIRGKSSISAGTQPLYVVDGVPITRGDYSQISMEGQGISAIADINPNNIKSVSILKDASAAAIYGARAGNGVVLIETKDGRKGETKINVKSYYGVQEVYEKLDMMNANEWKNYVRSFDPGFISSDLQKLAGDTTLNTNWQDRVLRKAPIANVELSASGGGEDTRFFLSGRYFKQKGVVLGTDYDKFNTRVNVDHDINDKFKLGAKLSLTYTDNDRVRGDQTINGVLPNAISMPPVYPVKNDDGSYFQGAWWDNPVAIGNEVVNKARSFRSLANIFGEYDILKGLTFKNQWGIDIYNLHERRFEPSIVQSAMNENGIGVDATSEVSKLTQQSTLNYTTSFNDAHNFNFLLGYSFELERRRYNSVRGKNFPTDELEYLASAGTIETGSSSALNEGIQSFFGRVKYNYENKYIVSLSVRRDGSSNFGPNNKYATFPSGSFAWRIAEEKFMDGVDWLDELKYRVSYGLTGNDQIGSLNYLPLFSSGYNYRGSAGIIPTQIPNQDLKWETTANFNTGFNLAMFDERIILETDLYYNKTTDLLLDRPLPGTSGYTSYAANVGSLENKGLEISLNTDLLRQTDFKWNSNFNISFNRNKVLEMYKGQPITNVGRGNNAAIEGEPLSVFYMYESLGVDPSTGELVFEDINGDGSYTDADRQVVGNPNPDFTGGFTNDFSYKNLTLSVFLQYTYGNDIYNGVRQYAENMTLGTNDNQLTTIKDRWREPGDVTYVPKYNGKYNNQISSQYIEDGSFLRVKNVTLNYRFGDDFLKNNFLNTASIYLKVENLYTLTGYSGMDPEVNYAGVGTLTAGTDFFTYPQVRTWTAGLKFQF
jgi:TonB-linked SusC/RagA family outer membrane protein